MRGLPAGPDTECAVLRTSMRTRAAVCLRMADVELLSRPTRSADRGSGRRHLRVRLVSNHNRPRAPHARKRPAIGLLCLIPRSIRVAGTSRAHRSAACPGQAWRDQTAHVHPAGRHPVRGQEDVQAKPLPGRLAGAQPGARPGLSIQAAKVTMWRPLLHELGGRAVSGTRRRPCGGSGAGRVPERLHRPLPSGERPVAGRLGRAGSPPLSRDMDRREAIHPRPLVDVRTPLAS